MCVYVCVCVCVCIVYVYICIGCAVLVEACGIEFPNQGLNPGHLHWEHRVLTTGPPGKFLLLFNHCCVWLFETPWTTACQASLSSRLLCPWNLPGKNTAVGKPFPSPRDLPDLGIEPRSPAWQTDSWPSEPIEKPREVLVVYINHRSRCIYFLCLYLSFQ